MFNAGFTSENEAVVTADGIIGALGYTPIDEAEKGVTVATLTGGVLTSSQIPGGLDEVLFFPDFASFPATGDPELVYVAEDTELVYRWSDTAVAYFQLSVPASGDLTETGSSILNIVGGAGAVLGSGTTIEVNTDLSDYNNTVSGFIALTSLTGVNGINYDNLTGDISVDFNTTNLKITGTELNTIQNIDTTASPTFSNVIANTAFLHGVASTVGGDLLYLQNNAGNARGSFISSGIGNWAVVRVGNTVNEYGIGLNIGTNLISLPAGSCGIYNNAGGISGSIWGVSNIGDMYLYGDIKMRAATLIDGRDVSVDGTKLDGIQAGAQVNAVTTVAGRTGAVVLASTDISGLGTLATLNFNTTNLQNTAGALNTIQDISQAATPIFDNLSITNDAAVEGDFGVGGTAYLFITHTDTINEETLGNGVTIEGVLVKDGLVAGKAVADLITLTDLSGGDGISYDDVTGVISADFDATNLQITSGQLNTIQNIDTTASPTFQNVYITASLLKNVVSSTEQIHIRDTGNVVFTGYSDSAAGASIRRNRRNLTTGPSANNADWSAGLNAYSAGPSPITPATTSYTLVSEGPTGTSGYLYEFTNTGTFKPAENIILATSKYLDADRIKPKTSAGLIIMDTANVNPLLFLFHPSSAAVNYMTIQSGIEVNAALGGIVAVGADSSSSSTHVGLNLLTKGNGEIFATSQIRTKNRTTAAIAALNSVHYGEGSLLYNSTTKALNYYNGTTWVPTSVAGLYKESFAPLEFNANSSGFGRVVPIAGSGNQRFGFPVPKDFNNLVQVVATLIPTSGTANGSGKDVDISVNYGKSGEAINNHTGTNTTNTYNFGATLNQIAEVDITSIFTAAGPTGAGIEAGDNVEFLWQNNAVGGTIHIKSIILRYT